MYGVTYNPNVETSDYVNINSDLEQSWSKINDSKLKSLVLEENVLENNTEISEPAELTTSLPKINKLEIGYLNPKDYQINTPKVTFSGDPQLRSALEEEMNKRGLDDTMKTFLIKSAILESGIQLNPKNVPTGIHTGGAHKGKQFRALGMWQILDTNLKGLPINDEATFMSNLSNQMENVLAMHKQSRAWLNSSGYLQKGLSKGYTEDELMYLMHHGWTGAVKKMIDENKSMGDVVNGADKGTAYTLNKYKQLKIN